MSNIFRLSTDQRVLSYKPESSYVSVYLSNDWKCFLRCTENLRITDLHVEI